MKRKQITDLTGKTIESITMSSSYLIIKFKNSNKQLQVSVYETFDKNGNRYLTDFVGY